MSSSKKIDFISNLLIHKNISTAEKERLFMLTKDEIKKLGEKDIEKLDEIVNRIEKLENRNTINSFEEDKKVVDEVKKTPIKTDHKPKEVTAFFKQFKENSALKFTTHTWDETYYDSIQTFIDKLNESKDYQKLFQINLDLFNLIKYFIYIPKVEVNSEGIPEFGWPGKFNDIKIGWQFPNQLLINWCRENFDNKEDKKYPFQYPLPKEFYPKRAIKGKMVTTFENIVDVFKTEIQFRDDYLFNELNKRKMKISGFDFYGIENFSGLNFYTYTSGVLSAVDTILNEIRKNETAKTVLFEYRIDENELIIDITQEGSYPVTRKLNTNNLSLFLGGGLNTIAGSLFGLCDFSVISRFKDENDRVLNGELKINYDGVEGERQKRDIKLISQPEFCEYDKTITGFTYRLKFYI